MNVIVLLQFFFPVTVLDLGSTNGTFRNGIRLKPREKTFLEKGDEIRMGRVCFDCR